MFSLLVSSQPLLPSTLDILEAPVYHRLPRLLGRDLLS